MDTDLRPLLLVATVSALSLTALVAIVALLTSDFGDTQLRILATTGGFGLASLIAMRGTALLDQRRHVALGRTVIGLCALSFLIELAILWLYIDSEEAWKSYVCAIAFAVALGQIAGMIARRRETDPPSIGPIVWAAGTCGVISAVMATAAALLEIDNGGYYRGFAVVVVLNVLLITLQPVVRRLSTRAPAAPSESSRANFVCVLADGRRVEGDADDDLPNAVADALRGLRRRGERVTRIELGGG
jgi:hypothetical protein